MMTHTQAILAKAVGKERLVAGEFIMAPVSLVIGNDITAPVAINYLSGFESPVFNSEKIALIPDHFTPNKDIASAEQCKTLRQFAYKHHIKHYYEVGQVGIEHALIPEKGLVHPEDIIIGADSHTCTHGALGAFATGIGSTDMAYAMKTGQIWLQVPSAIGIHVTGTLGHYVSGKDLILHLIGLMGVDGARYKSLEFFGSGIQNLTITDRLTICNMGIEAGAKNAYFPVDRVTQTYFRKEHGDAPPLSSHVDEGAYDEIIHLNLSTLHATVSKPHSPSHTSRVSELGHIPVDQVVIGSCTNGWYEDFVVVHGILKGRSVKKGLRLIMIPSTQAIYKKVCESGMMSDFIASGAVISPPSCGACLGGHMGVLASDEVCLSTTNRNFVGRMGHPSSQVYLASPATAAETAINGFISHPLKETI